MNKNISKIIIFTIICTALSTVIPSTINTASQSAYAYSDDEINSLKIISGFSGIPIYSSSSYNNEYKIKTGDKIPLVAYSKITSDKTNIKLDIIETKAADIRVFVGKENLKLADIYSNINIAEGEKKIIYVRLYNSKSDSDSEYTGEYELIVERKVNDNDDTDSKDETITIKQYDDIYLDNIILYDETKSNKQAIDFNFDKTQPIYNVNVAKDIPYIKIKAIPEQQSYSLKINDKEVDTHGNNKYERDISLDEGKNIIKIRIVDRDEHKAREYYLNVTRGISTSIIANTNTTSPQNIQIKAQAGWQYKKDDGTIAIGWTCIENQWYYFESTGALKTGWFQDTSGKWYYLKESGVMAKDTVIDGYKIGSDGVYISKLVYNKAHENK